MMKRHLVALFSNTNRKRTLSLLVASFILIAFSLVMGMKNNIPMNIMFVAGTGFLYLALIHTWRKAINYMYLMLSTLVIFPVLLLITYIASNMDNGSGSAGPARINIMIGGIYTIAGLGICIPGMVVGLLGTIILGCKTHQGETTWKSSEAKA